MLDTHCHIDLYPKPYDVLRECEKQDMTVLAMTNLPSHFEMGLPHVKLFKKIRLALGMHPLHVKKHNSEFPLFLKNLDKTSYIGEIGLDFSKEGYKTKADQLITFERILKIVSNQKKILSLHSRQAENEVFVRLKANKINAAIFHWYSGPLHLIRDIADAGYYFSINPYMIDKENGKRIISRIPIDRILTETDGPFTETNGMVSKPSDVFFVYKYLSELWGKSQKEVEYIVNSNFRQLVSFIK